MKPWWCEVVRSQIPDANLREKTKRGLCVKVKILSLERKKEEEGTMGIGGGGRERRKTQFFNFFYLFNLINLIH